MTKVEEPYIGYYSSANIIPARQNLNDLKGHFRRRDALYRMLGLAPGLLAGKSILEIGPGPGDNAIHTQSLNPARYVLVDANPASLAAIREKLADGSLDRAIVEATEGNLLNYVPDQKFDVVLCEGLLPGQRDPMKSLTRISEFVSPGGIIVITNMTTYSMLSEICRRVVKPYFARRAQENQKLVAALTKFFTPDLDSLKHASRRYEDWVLDTILHPWAKNMSFSIPDAIQCLQPAFEFYGSSPQFLTDTRWYKLFADSQITTNAVALTQYRSKKLIFLDYRIDHIDQDVDIERLDKLVDDAIDLHSNVWNGATDNLDVFLQRINAISELIRPALPLTSQSLDDYVRGMNSLAADDSNADFGRFIGFFGRGQQYSSFVRCR